MFFFETKSRLTNFSNMLYFGKHEILVSTRLRSSALIRKLTISNTVMQKTKRH